MYKKNWQTEKTLLYAGSILETKLFVNLNKYSIPCK